MNKTSRPEIAKYFNYKTKKPAVFTEAEIKVFKTIGGVVLAVIATAGVMTMSAIAPNIFSVIGKFKSKKLNGYGMSKREKQKQAVQTLYYLKKHNLIKFKKTAKEVFLTITKKGKKCFENINFYNIKVEKPSNWNGKWWLIAADIPTKPYRNSADKFRQKMKDMQIKSLQRTLWIYPFDPRKELEYLANYYGIGKFVTVMEINRLDKSDEQVLKAYYKLIKVL